MGTFYFAAWTNVPPNTSGKTSFGTAISIFVDSVHNTLMDTNCNSAPVGIGSHRGDFAVVGGGSENQAVLLCDCDFELAPPGCDDGVDCTDDYCIGDESNPSCENIPNDGTCDNGLYCDGAETCDALSDCQPGPGDPCSPDLVCDEANDTCVGWPRRPRLRRRLVLQR